MTAFRSCLLALVAVAFASPAMAAFYRPAVASNGTDFLVAWQHGDPTTGFVITAQRVSASGMLLGDPIVICDATIHPIRSCTNVRVAYAGGTYLVTWTNLYGSAYGQLIDAASGIMAPICGTYTRHDGARPVCNWNDSFGIAAVTETPRGNFLVVLERGDLIGYEMTPTGMFYASGYIAPGEGGTDPALVYSEEHAAYYIAYRRSLGVDRDAVGLWRIELDPPFRSSPFFCVIG